MNAVRCPVCDLALPDDVVCPNYWCHRADRGFDVVWAIAPYRARLRQAVTRLKYRGERRWIAPLANLLAGYLLDRAPCFDDIDLIVAIPGLGRPVDQTREILDAAAPRVGRLWPVERRATPVLGKRAPTRRLVETPSAPVRRLWAAGELRAALVVHDPSRVRGRRVLAVDDVFTDGSTMREVAGALRDAGAVAVSGLVLGRAPLTT